MRLFSRSYSNKVCRAILPLEWYKSTQNFGKVICGDQKIVNIKRIIPVKPGVAIVEEHPFISISNNFLSLQECGNIIDK